MFKEKITKAAGMSLHNERYSTFAMFTIVVIFLCMSGDAFAADSKITALTDITTNLNAWLGGDLKKAAIYILGISVTVISAIKGAWSGAVTGVVIIVFNILLQGYIGGL